MSTFTLPLFPLPEVFLYPGTFLPLHIFEPRYRSMLEFTMENGGEIGLAPFPKTWKGLGRPPLPEIVGYGHVIQKESFPDGRSNILVEGLGTARVLSIESTDPFYISQVERRIHEKNPKNDSEFSERLNELLHLTKRILLSEGADESLILKMNQIFEHPYPVDFIASILYFDFRTRQEILEETNVRTKSTRLREILMELNLTE